MKITGRVWKFGDDINTDLIQPIFALLMPRREQAKYCMSANRPGWADQVRPGDIIVAGRNFGTGSSRPAARVLKDLGLGGLLADSINGLFFRNCVNHALPALGIEGISHGFQEGDQAEIDFGQATVVNLRTGKVLSTEPWPAMLRDILEAGGTLAALDRAGLLRPPDSDTRRSMEPRAR